MNILAALMLALGLHDMLLAQRLRQRGVDGRLSVGVSVPDQMLLGAASAVTGLVLLVGDALPATVVGVSAGVAPLVVLAVGWRARRARGRRA